MHYQWDFFFLLRYTPLFWKGVLVTLAYTAGTIIAMGLVSLCCAHDLASGSALARAVCGYIALFWAARLVLQRTYDFRPHLGSLWLRLGYHALTPLFVFFVVFYGCLALR